MRRRLAQALCEHCHVASARLHLPSCIVSARHRVVPLLRAGHTVNLTVNLPRLEWRTPLSGFHFWFFQLDSGGASDRQNGCHGEYPLPDLRSFFLSSFLSFFLAQLHCCIAAAHCIDARLLGIDVVTPHPALQASRTSQLKEAAKPTTASHRVPCLAPSPQSLSCAGAAHSTATVCLGV